MNPNLLLVDDNRKWPYTLKKTFDNIAKHNFSGINLDFCIVHSIDEAEKAIELENDFNVFIVDGMMTSTSYAGDGIEYAEQLQNRFPNKEVAIVSAYRVKIDAAVAKGFRRVLRKDSEVEEIETWIITLLHEVIDDMEG